MQDCISLHQLLMPVTLILFSGPPMWPSTVPVMSGLHFH